MEWLKHAIALKKIGLQPARALGKQLARKFRARHAIGPDRTESSLCMQFSKVGIELLPERVFNNMQVS
jgi:hypothetical protein